MLSEIKTEEDKDALWQRLYEVDPESAEKIHKNNLRRLLRALEVYETTGKPKSYFDKLSRECGGDISLKMITLDFHNRDNLYKRVDMRVDMMIEDGLLDEVNALYAAGLLGDATTAAQAIGYKEMLLYIKGDISCGEAIELIKLSTRRYAKRQLTWFRHVKDAYRLYLDTENGQMRSFDEILKEALDVFA